MTKRQMASLIRKLEKERDTIGKSRDKLREIIGEYENLAETAEQAYDDIENVIQTLSQYV